MDMFSNLDMHNGSNLSLPHQHAQQQQQQQPMEGVTQGQTQDSPMSNAQTSPGSSGGSDVSHQQQQQQGQNHGPVISQSSELAFALQPVSFTFLCLVKRLSNLLLFFTIFYVITGQHPLTPGQYRRRQRRRLVGDAARATAAL